LGRSTAKVVMNRPLLQGQRLTCCAGFGTSISNWVITLDALEPFSCNPKTVQDPVPFDHLRWRSDGDGALDIKLRITLISQSYRFLERPGGLY